MSRIGPTHGAPTVFPNVFWPCGALVDDHDLHADAQRPEALGLGLDPGRLGRNLQAGRRARGDELRRDLELGTDHADLDPVDREHTDGVTQGGVCPVAASTMFVARNGNFARAWCANRRSRP